jgi:hypothetical protein
MVAQPGIAIAANTLLIPSPGLVHDWQRFEQTALIGLDVRVGNSETRRAGRVRVVHRTVAVPLLDPGFLTNDEHQGSSGYKQPGNWIPQSHINAPLGAIALANQAATL